MIWLLPHPVPSSPSGSLTGDTQHKTTEKERQLAVGRGGEGGRKIQIIRRRESLVLYKLFNTLWPKPSCGGSFERRIRDPAECRKILQKFHMHKPKEEQNKIAPPPHPPRVVSKRKFIFEYKRMYNASIAILQLVLYIVKGRHRGI
jgi:hypothetical protein